MSKAVANLTQLNETITFSAQDNGETINVKINELARGPAGADGPNEITTATTTDLTGYIYGDGTNVAGATSAATTMDADSLVLRDASGSSEFYSINLNTQDIFGVQATTTIAANNDTSLENNVVFTLPLASGYGAITGNSNGVVDIAHGGTNCNTLAAVRELLTLGASGTITTSQPLSLTQTWNAGAVTFKGIDVNITDTASASGSLLMDLRVGGVSKFSVDKTGTLTIPAFPGKIVFSGAWSMNGSSSGLTMASASGSDYFRFTSNLFRLNSGIQIGWVAGNDPNTTADLILGRDTANTLAQRNGTNAQVTRVYDTYTSATDYHRLAIATARATATAMSGATVTLTNIIPAGAVVVGVTCKVTTAITGATSFDIGTATDVDRFGAAIATALGTTSDNRNWTAGTIECFPAATSLILTANGSNFTAGAVYVSVQYLSGQAD